MSKLDASRVYLVMGGATALLRGTTYLVLTVYYVLIVHMNPLQLVLVGTVLEIGYFLFQIPTGLFADTFGRRRSVVAGWALVGACFTFEGLVPDVTVILALQGVLGLGEALIDGAESAWLADEVGEERFGEVLLRASQVGQVLAVVAILLAAALGSIRLNLPIVVGGCGMVAMSVFFAATMPEAGFRRRQDHDGAVLSTMRGTLRDGVRVVRGSTILVTILAVEFFTGAGSEGFDRLWQAHLIRDIRLPLAGSLHPVVLFAAIAIAQNILVFAVTRLLQPRLILLTGNPKMMARILAVLNVIDVLCIVGFAIAGNFGLAVAALLLRASTFAPAELLRTVWYNKHITDSGVRATVLSLTGQSNALGQWIGGPAVGLLGSAVTVGAAIAATGIIRSPVSLLYLLSARGGGGASSGVERQAVGEIAI